MKAAGKRPASGAKRAQRPTKRATSRIERREETRRRLIEATVACMRKVGYAATTTTMISRQAKVSRGALQHHFRSRDDLFLAVTERVGADLAAAFGSRISMAMPVEQRVQRICETYWQVYRSDAFVAQVQIWIGAHNDRQLQARMQSLARGMLRAQNRLWHRSFADLAVRPERLAALRGLTLSALRGLALRPAYRPESSARPREVAALCEMVSAALKSPGSAAQAVVPMRGWERRRKTMRWPVASGGATRARAAGF